MFLPVKFGIVFHIEQFDVAQDGSGNDCIGNVFDLAGILTANLALPHHVRVEVPAVVALHSQVRKLVAYQQGLHFAKLQRL